MAYPMWHMRSHAAAVGFEAYDGMLPGSGFAVREEVSAIHHRPEDLFDFCGHESVLHQTPHGFQDWTDEYQHDMLCAEAKASFDEQYLGVLGSSSLACQSQWDPPEGENYPLRSDERLDDCQSRCATQQLPVSFATQQCGIFVEHVPKQPIAPHRVSITSEAPDEREAMAAGLPQCCCGRVCLLRKVSKAGANKGRQFLVCRGEQCGYFQWADEPLKPICPCGQQCARATVRKEGANMGRLFWTCSKKKGSQCGYFQWADKLPSTPAIPGTEWSPSDAACDSLSSGTASRGNPMRSVSKPKLPCRKVKEPVKKEAREKAWEVSIPSPWTLYRVLYEVGMTKRRHGFCDGALAVAHDGTAVVLSSAGQKVKHLKIGAGRHNMLQHRERIMDIGIVVFVDCPIGLKAAKSGTVFLKTSVLRSFDPNELCAAPVVVSSAGVACPPERVNELRTRDVTPNGDEMKCDTESTNVNGTIAWVNSQKKRKDHSLFEADVANAANPRLAHSAEDALKSANVALPVAASAPGPASEVCGSIRQVRSSGRGRGRGRGRQGRGSRGQDAFSVDHEEAGVGPRAIQGTCAEASSIEELVGRRRTNQSFCFGGGFGKPVGAFPIATSASDDDTNKVSTGYPAAVLGSGQQDASGLEKKVAELATGSSVCLSSSDSGKGSISAHGADIVRKGGPEAALLAGVVADNSGRAKVRKQASSSKRQRREVVNKTDVAKESRHSPFLFQVYSERNEC